jgi:phasin
MARNSSENFEIPSEMRAFAEKSVEQARQAFDSFLSAASRTVSTFEGQAESARQGAHDIGRKAMAFAEQNIVNSFELAQKLVRAKDVEEILRLQGDYITAQMQALTEQAKELGESTGRVVQSSTSPHH